MNRRAFLGTGAMAVTAVFVDGVQVPFVQDSPTTVLYKDEHWDISDADLLRDYDLLTTVLDHDLVLSHMPTRTARLLAERAQMLLNEAIERYGFRIEDLGKSLDAPFWTFEEFDA